MVAVARFMMTLPQIPHEMTRIKVQLQRAPYDVVIADDLRHRAGLELRSLGHFSQVLVVSSRRVHRLWGRDVIRSLARESLRHSVILMPDGEGAKRFTAVERLTRAMVRQGADRKSVVLAVGGGVIGDLAGFAAAIFMRGIPIVQLPTTLLAQVDAAIGGKTGVNLPEGKNLVGSFHQPARVLVDPVVLRTLPERELRAGMFEVIKCGVIADAALFRELESHVTSRRRPPAALTAAIIRAARVKARIVAADERESGQRRLLNFGHTLGHAFEAATGYRQLLHGEAVGWGMIAAAEIGVHVGVTPVAVAERIVSLVVANGPLPKFKTSIQRILEAMAHDKKVSDRKVHMVLAERIGKASVHAGITPAAIRRALDSVLAAAR